MSSVNESVDYANYLLEVQESKASVMREWTGSTQTSSLVGGSVEKKVIDFATFKKEEPKPEPKPDPKANVIKQL